MPKKGKGLKKKQNEERMGEYVRRAKREHWKRQMVGWK